MSHLAFAIVIAGTGISCNRPEPLKPVFPATGRVTFEGKPAAGALVVFHPIDDPVRNILDPRAIVQDDGTFAVSTHNANDGAPPGKYRVTIHWHRPQSGPSEGRPGVERGLLPSRFEDPNFSGLGAEIREGTNEIPPFELKR